MRVCREYRDILLHQADQALQIAYELLDKKFGNQIWREKQFLIDIADKLRQEVRGFNTWEEAVMEAAQRNKNRFGNDPIWCAYHNDKGHPIVRIYGSE